MERGEGVRGQGGRLPLDITGYKNGGIYGRWNVTHVRGRHGTTKSPRY